MARRIPPRHFSFSLLSTLLAAPILQAATLAEYGFTSDLSATTVEPGVIAGDIVEGGNFSQFTPGDTTNAGGSSPHLRAAGFGFSPTPTITWTLEPSNPGAALDLSSGAFYFQYYITPSGITNADLQYAINDGSFTTLTNIGVSRVSEWRSSTTSLASIGVLDAGDSISFRFTNGGGSNGSALNLDTFRISGEVVPVPEPATTMFAALGVLLVLGRRRADR